MAKKAPSRPASARAPSKKDDVAAPVSVRAVSKTDDVATPVSSVRAASKNDDVAAPRSRQPSHDEIAQRAFALYLARNGNDGGDMGDWLRAESELSRA